MNDESGSTSIKIKRSTLYKFSGFLILAILVFMLFNSANSTSTTSSKSLIGNIVANSGSNGNVQVVKMHVEGGQYILEPSTFKANVPVRIEADISRMPGCSKSVVIPGFNVRKNLNTNDNIIEFTPDKAGTFNIACSMNMYRGTFIVLSADGTKSNYVDKTNPIGGSCGGSGGGCGCGG